MLGITIWGDGRHCATGMHGDEIEAYRITVQVAEKVQEERSSRTRTVPRTHSTEVRSSKQPRMAALPDFSATCAVGGTLVCTNGVERKRFA